MAFCLCTTFIVVIISSSCVSCCASEALDFICFCFKCAHFLYFFFFRCCCCPRNIHPFMVHGCTRWCAHYAERKRVLVIFVVVDFFFGILLQFSQSSKASYHLMCVCVCAYYRTYFYFYNQFACLKCCHWVTWAEKWKKGKRTLGKWGKE